MLILCVNFLTDISFVCNDDVGDLLQVFKEKSYFRHFFLLICEGMVAWCVDMVSHKFCRILQPLAVNLFYAFELQITPLGNKMVLINLKSTIDMLVPYKM